MVLTKVGIQDWMFPNKWGTPLENSWFFLIHEEICECFYKRLKDAFDPSELLVMCLYARRGGIDINPVRASSQDLIEKYAANLIDINAVHIKTSKQ